MRISLDFILPPLMIPSQDVLRSVGVDTPDCTTTWCCNYFQVHKSRVLQHSRNVYETFLDFVLKDRPDEAGWKHGGTDSCVPPDVHFG
jgi:hypothetical protein